MKLFLSYFLIVILLASIKSEAGLKHLTLSSNESDIWSKCSDYEGYRLSENGRPQDNYGVHSAKCDGQYQIWVTKNDKIFNPKTNRTDLKRTVVDHKLIRSLKEGEFFSSGPYCYIKGNINAVDWSAIYYWKGKQKASLGNGGLRDAWVVNPNTKKIEVASTKLMSSVVCPKESDE